MGVAKLNIEICIGTVIHLFVPVLTINQALETRYVFGCLMVLFGKTEDVEPIPVLSINAYNGREDAGAL
jgi:hypothetical protein